MKCPSAILILGLAAAPVGAQSHLEEALNIYSELSGRTLLRASGLTELTGSIISKEEALADKNRALNLIVSELAKGSIQIVPDGEAFARVLDSSWTNAPATACLARIPPPPSHQQGQVGNMINFTGADLKQVLDIYSMLRQRTILQPASLPSVTIKLLTLAPLTKEETIYAMNVVLALNGIAAVDDGEHFVQVVHAGQLSMVKPHAPKPEPDEPQLKPNEILPSETVQTRPPPGTVGSVHLGQTADKLAELYARLNGQTAIASSKYGQMPVHFEMTIPLTKQEVLYAVETTLAFSGLVVESAGERLIQVGRAKLGKPVGR